MNSFTNALGLDVGQARIGVARINYIAQLSEPLAVLPNNEEFSTELKKIISDQSIDLIVVGMPRNMQGEKTAQSEYVESFVATTLRSFDLPVLFQDETLSTVAAAERVSDKTKAMEDAFAAAVILEDFISSNG